MSSRSATWPMSISATCSTISPTDPHTRAILLYVEGITHGRKFMSAARAAARLKPVLVLKAGRSQAGARAAASHTGMLAGSDASMTPRSAAPACCGSATMAELFDAAETLALTARAARRAARDPDQWRRRRRSRDRRAGRARRAARRHCRPRRSRGSTGCCRRPGAAAIRSTSSATRRERVMRRRSTRCSPTRGRRGAGAQLPDGARGSGGGGAGRHRRDGVAARRDAARPQPVHRLARRALRGAGARAVQRGPDADLRNARGRRSPGLLHRVRYQRNQALLMETPAGAARSGRSPIPALPAPRSPPPSPPADPGSTRPKSRPCSTPTASRARNRVSPPIPTRPPPRPLRIGFPVALKIRSPDIVHKTDVGGIALGSRRCRSGARGRRRDARAHRRRDARKPGSTGSSCSRWSRADDAHRAARRASPTIRSSGPVILFGQGGTAVEVVRRQRRRAAAAQSAAGARPDGRAPASGGCCKAIATSRRPRSMRSPRC